MYRGLAMAKKLYVGNLSWITTEDTLKDAFGIFGALKSVKIIMDRDTGKSKGFGFVDFATEQDGVTAQNTLNGTEIDGRKLMVNEAHEKPRVG